MKCIDQKHFINCFFSKSLWEMTILFTLTFNDFREFNRNDKNQGIFYFSNLWCDNKNNQPSCFVEACKLHSKINIFGALLCTIQYLYWNVIKFAIKFIMCRFQIVMKILKVCFDFSPVFLITLILIDIVILYSNTINHIV